MKIKPWNTKLQHQKSRRNPPFGWFFQLSEAIIITTIPRHQQRNVDTTTPLLTFMNLSTIIGITILSTIIIIAKESFPPTASTIRHHITHGHPLKANIRVTVLRVLAVMVLQHHQPPHKSKLSPNRQWSKLLLEIWHVYVTPKKPLRPFIMIFTYHVHVSIVI